MLIPMLKAIHKMLEGADKAKVECASTVLGELITHLETHVPAGAVYDGPRSYIDKELDPEAVDAQKELMP